MYRLTIFFVIILIGMCGVIHAEDDSSEENILLKFACDTFTDLIEVWREFAVTVDQLKVEFYTYNEADDESEYDSVDFEYDFDLFGDDDDDFDPTVNRTVVLVHGYLGSYKDEWVVSLRNALFHWRKRNMSVIVVNWFKSFNYYTAAGSVKEVAEEIYEHLKDIAEQYDEKNKTRPYLHIMGHSLGAHAAGLAAKMLKNKFKWTANRLTGLDPAKPFFNIGEDFQKYRLNKSYAKFVDVIHTNSAKNLSTFGLYDPMGHIDFYPNGGDKQPVCAKQRGKSLTSKSYSHGSCPKSDVYECLKHLGHDVACLTSDMAVEKENMLCDHGEAPHYFTKSLKGEKFLGIEFGSTDDRSHGDCHHECCKTKVSMGIMAAKCRKSTYFGQYNVKVTE